MVSPPALATGCNRVLIADDDLFFRMLARETLEEAGFLVEDASDGVQAVEAFLHTQPDLILLDVFMPRKDGFAVCREVRNHPKGTNTAILMMTAMDDSDSIKLAYEVGATDFMIKPVNWFIVGQRAQYMIRNKLAQDELLAKEHQLDSLNRTLEDQIAQKLAELRHKDQILIEQGRFASMGEMISNIAHQWRQPLNSLGLTIQDIKVTYDDDALTSEVIDRQVDRAMDVIDFMSQTIDDFRSFFQPQGGKLRDFLVTESIDKSLALLRPSLNSCGITIECSHDDDFDLAMVPGEFCQVLINIVNNAREVLVERKVTNPRISIQSFREDGRAVVAIRDNAGGIEEKVLPRIFDPYFTTKHEAQGTGIGLYMSRMIIEKRMGGSLSVCNNDGWTEFRIAL